MQSKRRSFSYPWTAVAAGDWAAMVAAADAACQAAAAAAVAVAGDPAGFAADLASAKGENADGVNCRGSPFLSNIFFSPAHMIFIWHIPSTVRVARAL